MHHAVQEEEPVRYGPLDARSPQNVYGHGNGIFSIFWWTKTQPGVKIETIEYQPYPFRRVNNMDQGREHLLTLWKKLDAEIDTIRASSPELTEYNKTRASTLAEVIAQLMSMFYADTNAVLVESMNRWTARQEGREHQTPGLAEHVWDPTTRYSGPAFNAATRNVGAPVKMKIQFDDAKTNFIKHCLQTGIQTPETLATMFSCSVDDIRAVVD
jgi:hypothetical protein